VWVSDLKIGKEILLETKILFVLEIGELFRIWTNLRNIAKMIALDWFQFSRVTEHGRNYREFKVDEIRYLERNVQKMSAASKNLNV
jgi:hypothetical protein